MSAVHLGGESATAPPLTRATATASDPYRVKLTTREERHPDKEVSSRPFVSTFTRTATFDP